MSIRAYRAYLSYYIIVYSNAVNEMIINQMFNCLLMSPLILSMLSFSLNRSCGTGSSWHNRKSTTDSCTKETKFCHYGLDRISSKYLILLIGNAFVRQNRKKVSLFLLMKVLFCFQLTNSN